MSKLTLTLRVVSDTERPKYAHQAYNTETVTESETLCDIDGQHFSKGMLGAALRQLADEVDPPKSIQNGSDKNVAWRDGRPVMF